MERGDEGKCGDLKVADAYELAMGTPMETALAVFNVDLAQVALQVNRMIHRLDSARQAEAKTEGQAPCPAAPGRAGTADGGPSGDAGGIGHAPAEGDGHGT